MTSFGNIVKPPAPEKCIGDALVNEGAEAPKPYLPPVEVRMLSSAAGGLLLADTVSTTIRVIFPHHLFLGASLNRPRRGILVRQTAGQTSISLPPSLLEESHRNKIKAKYGLDPGGCSGRRRGCPFLGGRYALHLGGGMFGTLR